uniref:Uncharacterized protein n=1 Tax=Anopheles atroparvus TaxID=41427 RepID=A0A182JHK6_ANOAO
MLTSVLQVPPLSPAGDLPGAGPFFPKNISANRPLNTNTVPIHWRPESTFPKKSTEKSTVKNFRVVVTTEQARAPKVDTIMKMNSCPRAPAQDEQHLTECFVLQIRTGVRLSIFVHEQHHADDYEHHEEVLLQRIAFASNEHTEKHHWDGLGGLRHDLHGVGNPPEGHTRAYHRKQVRQGTAGVVHFRCPIGRLRCDREQH